MAKKSDSGVGILVLVGIVVVILSSISKEVWIGLGVIAALGAAIYFYTQSQKKKQQADQAAFQRDFSSSQQSSGDRPVSMGIHALSKGSDVFKIPAKPKGIGPAKWLRPGETVAVAGAQLTGGLLYVGTSLPTPHGENDPCLVNTNKSVASRGDFTEPLGGYWPSYSGITNEARRAYLNWLVDGRKHPEADIGYVFMYFYGLERRAVVDASRDPAAEEDWPVIGEELRRLLGIYGEKSSSFKRYATELLNWIEVSHFDTKLYLQPVPKFAKSWELPLYVRLALGRAALDGAPVPPSLALAWVKLDPAIPLRTPATRCPDEFDKLFLHKYQQQFGEGLVLPKNKTKLKFVYRPASSGLHGYGEIKLTFGETPDITVLTAPIGKLRQLVDKVTEELAAYSRFVGKATNQRNSLEGLLQLSMTLWPDKPKAALSALTDRMESGVLILPFQELLAVFEAQTSPTKDKVIGLATALETMNIGMEPDVLNGAKPPKLGDKVVLFAHQPIEPLVRNSPAYHAALLTLQLSAAVATADGDFTEQEMAHLRSQIQSWNHLTPGHLQRLMAHLKLLMDTPVSLPSLKKKLEPLELPAREAIASFMATLAQADGTVSPDEVKMLEKVYKALGVEPKKVFSDVHAAAAGGTSAKVESAGFKLDSARIAALQRDTEKVTELLSNIFKEDAPVVPEPVELEPETDMQDVTSELSFLGLDETHSSLARLLLSRPQWSRQELMDAAADLDLMLDGALEQINEASFDTFDIALTEGEDPIEVNAEILKKIEA